MVTDLNIISPRLRRFFNKTFTDIVIAAPREEIEKIAGEPVMVVCTHRSHVDYVLIGMVVWELGLKGLRFAAGDNLTRLPVIGPRLKAYGAFTVERHNVGRGYIRELARQVVGMIKNRETVIVFPEGGRSYAGSMMEVRGGVIGSALMAQSEMADRDVWYLPAAISYEQLPELNRFALLKKGKKLLRPGNGLFRRLYGSICYYGADILAFTLFMHAWRIKKKYSRVFIDFGIPCRVNDLVDLKKKVNREARDDFSAHRAAMQETGLELYRRFVSLYRLLPHHVLGRVLVDYGSLSREDAAARCVEVMARCTERKRNMKSLESLSGEVCVDEGIKRLQPFKAVHLTGEGKISVDKPDIVSYYARTIE